MGTFKASHISAAIGARHAVKASLRQMEEWGCTVSVGWVESGLFETTWHNITIDGPDFAVSRFHRWLADQTGRLV